MKEIYLECNNGGNYFRLTQSEEQEKEDICYIEVGHCCVIILRAIIPVAFLTDLIAQFTFRNINGEYRVAEKFKDYIGEVFNYDEEFNNKLCSKVKELNWLGEEK